MVSVDPSDSRAQVPEPWPTDDRAPASQELTSVPHEYQHAISEFVTRTPGLLKRLATRYKRAEQARQKVVGRVERVAELRADIARADREATAAEERLGQHPPTTGHPHDAARRTLSPPLYVLVLGAAGLLGYLLDKGALLVLLLPRSITESIALLAVFLTLVAAHWGGHVLRRRHQVVEARTVLGRPEILLGRVCIAAGYLLGAVVALIRTADGGIAPGLLFLVLGVLDFTVALVASYFFAHDGVSAVERTARTRRRLRRRETRRRRALQRAIARWRTTCRRLVDESGAVVGEADQILRAGVDTWKRTHPDAPAPVPPQPTWLVDARKLAAGRLLPALDIRPILMRAGLEPEEVL